MMTAASPIRILIIRLSAIGDVVVTTPVSRALREHFPDAHLAWVVEPGASDILAGNPYLDEVIVWQRPKGALTPRHMLDLRRQLRGGEWDWAIDCQGLLRSALVARLAGARTIVGNRNAKEAADLLYHVRVARSGSDRSSRQRCLDLLAPLGVHSQDRRMVLPVGDQERAAAADTLEESGVSPGEPYACLVPATTWRQKHWFEDRWAELAGLFRRNLGLTPVLMGSRADRALVDAIASRSTGDCVSAAGKTSLRTAAAMLKGARLTVSVDTALMHASVAVGTPTVGLAGASWWPGFQDYENFSLLREPMSCSPCLHRPTCGGRYDCMRALTADRVLAAAHGLLRC